MSARAQAAVHRNAAVVRILVQSREGLHHGGTADCGVGAARQKSGARTARGEKGRREGQGAESGRAQLACESAGAAGAWARTSNHQRVSRQGCPAGEADSERSGVARGAAVARCRLDAVQAGGGAQRHAAGGEERLVAAGQGRRETRAITRSSGYTTVAATPCGATCAATGAKEGTTDRWCE